MVIEEDMHRYYDDDGTEINPEFIPKPGLCITCRKDDAGGKAEMLCMLNRMDQQGEEHFECGAYEHKNQQGPG